MHKRRVFSVAAGLLLARHRLRIEFRAHQANGLFHPTALLITAGHAYFTDLRNVPIPFGYTLTAR